MHRTAQPLLGNAQALDGGSMFGNCPRVVWERWLPPDAEGRVELACRCLLVEERPRADAPVARRVLLETGIGSFFPPALRARYGVLSARHELLEGLAARGLGPDDIDVIVLSHLHFDHAGGLLAAHEDGAPVRLVFPRATFVVGRRAFERARAPHARDRASFIEGLPDLLEASGRLALVEPPTSDVLGGGWRLRESDGHTPGLLLVEVDLADGPVLFVSDLVPGAPWVHVPITMGYDRFPELVVDEKAQVLADAYSRGVRLVFTHDPTLAMARLERDERGRYRAEAAAS